ncbi:NACHT domain-containing protein [Actinokineospora sp.]|uniref:NACHT domain-containing protein n=1 Tax=Actinokineospora sp. TaxID=1872133 RepID=UPI0040379349
MAVKALLAALAVVFTVLVGVATELVTSGDPVPAWLWAGFAAGVLAAVAIAVLTAIRTDSAPGQGPTRARKKLRALVHRAWIQDVLQRAVDPATRFVVPLRAHRQAEHSFRLAPPVRQADPPPDQSIDTAFDDADGRLLILGGAGSGKTILLLDLARVLLDRAADADEPVPVVLHLSSWDGGPLAAWVAAEIGVHYARAGLSAKAAARWLPAGRIVVLLDGLDEVATERLARCVKAVNAFAAVDTHAGIVVCCRQEVHSGLEVGVRLDATVTVQPLSDETVERYLRQVDPAFVDIDADADLRALLATPLLLSTVGRNLHAVDRLPARPGATAEERGHDLIDAYIAELMARPRAPLTEPLSEDRLRATVRFLAGTVRPGGIFYPDEIASYARPRDRAIRFGAAVVAALGVLAVILGATAIFGGQEFGGDAWLGAAFVSAAGGFVVYRGHDPGSGLAGRLHWAREPAIRWMMIFLRGAWFVSGVLLIGSAYGFVGDLVERGPVRAWESWGLPIAGVSPLRQLVTVVALPMLIGAPLGLLTGLVAGLRGSRGEPPDRPLSTVRSSRRNLVVGVLLGPVAGFVLGSAFLVVFDLREAQDVADAYSVGGAIGVVVGAVVALRSGGGAYVGYLLARRELHRAGTLPWRLLPFLDYADSRMLLRRVGGGYMFPHRLIQDRLAR